MSCEPERQSRKTDNSSQDEDNEKEKLNVHSANSWETADLGDSDRKNKFLRLMGAGKKEHHGKFVIGDQNKGHERKKDETEEVTKDLENQFNRGMEHRLTGGRKGHTGLGFHEEQKAAEPDTLEGAEGKCELKSDQNEIRGGGNDVESEIGDSVDNNKRENSTESSHKHTYTDDKNESESPTAAKKMKFVKGSS